MSFEFIYRYWDQVHTKHENLLSIYIIGIRTETKQRTNVVYYTKDIYLSVYLYLIIKLFVCVKDMRCLRIAIPAYCFKISGSNFSVLFRLLIK